MLATVGWILVIGLLVWAVVVFNLLIRDRNRVRQAWSDVDVQLTRRYDLVPRLVEMVKGYASYERALLTGVAELRSQGLALASPGSRGEVERSLGTGVQRLIAIAESYPDLKASENFLDLQHKLVDTEGQIQFARRYYNGAVNAFNTRIDQFPDLVVARLLRFRPAEFFNLDEPAHAQAPKVEVS